MAVTPRTFFQPFAAAVFNGVHNFATDTLKIALTNIEPVNTYANLSQITQIAAGGGYSAGGFAVTTTSSTQASGVYRLTLGDYTLTASGTIAEWRYAVLYNDTVAGDPLICWYTFAVPFNLTSGNTFLFGIDGANGAINTAPGGASSGSVSVAVAPSSVAEDGAPNLVFTFTRTGITTSALTVNYAIGGTAVNGTDYASIGATATFGIGSATTTVTVNPTTDATIESNETVILTVAPGSGYVVGSPSSATGAINDDDAATDPDFANVSLLLKFNGTNGSTTFTDLSSYGHTVTAVGNAQVSTAQSVFDGASLLCDGTGDYLSIADHAAFDFGTGDFTIEMRVRFINVEQCTLIGASGSGGLFFANAIAGLSPSPNGISNGRSAVAFDNLTGSLPTTGIWYALAMTRSGTDLRFFLDGAQIGSTFTNSTSYDLSTGGMVIGSLHNGYIDELRVTKAVARYTANYTVDASGFPTS